MNNPPLNQTFSIPYARPITILPPLNQNMTFNPNYNNNNLPNNNSYNPKNPIYNYPINNNPSAINPSLTIAPPIPNYYKQNINSGNYYNHLPNIAQNNLNYSTPEILAKSFSNNLIKLKNLEDKINKNVKEIEEEENLPSIKEDQKKELKTILKENANYKMTSPEDPNLKTKFDEIKNVKSNIPEYIQEEDIKIQKKKELMSKKGLEDFNTKLQSNLNEYSEFITNQIKLDNEKNNDYYNMIRHNLEKIKDELTKEIDDFNQISKNGISDIRQVMLKLPQTRLRLLAKRLIPDKKMDDDEDNEEKEKLQKENILKDVKRMSIMIGKTADAEKQRDLMNKAIEKVALEKKNTVKNGKNIELDLWEKNRIHDNKIYKKVDSRFSLFNPSFVSMKPINHFRKYVYVIIAARRILNIKYIVYKTLKFKSITYFLTYYEDMDIILKKNVFYAIREPFTEIITNRKLDLNLVVDKDVDQHQNYVDLQDYIQRIIKGLQTKFFEGLSDSMLKFLSIFVCNYSYIPSDFFCLFELVRFQTTDTGEFIGLNKKQRIMILGFYIIIKILLRNLFLEMIFNQNSIATLNRKIKLNIKMIVSVLYRGTINMLKKECETKRNLEDVEKTIDKDNFFKICYGKKEFHISQLLTKRYYLKEAYTDNEINQGRKKRVSERVEAEIDPDNRNMSRRRPRQTQRVKNRSRLRKNQKAKKFKEEEEEEEEEENEEEDKKKKRSISKKKRLSSKKRKRRESYDSDDEPGDPNSESSEETPEIPRRKTKRKKTNLKKTAQDEYYKNKEKLIKIEDIKSEDLNKFDEYTIKTKSDEAKRVKKRQSKKDQINEVIDLKEKRKKQMRRDNRKRGIIEYDYNKKKENNNDSQRLNTKNFSRSKPKKSKSKSKSKKKNKKNEDSEEEEIRNNQRVKKRVNPNNNIKIINMQQILESKAQKRALPDLEKDLIAEKRGRFAIKDYTNEDIENMRYIIENIQSFGDDDIDPNDVMLLDNALYEDEQLDVYYLWAEETKFDPFKDIKAFLEKILDMIQNNFSKEEIKIK